jgi:hypothetical protein
MSWATPYIEALKTQETIQFRPRGNSMDPLVKDRQLVTVRRVTADTPIIRGTVVLCTVRGRQYLHLVKAVCEGRYLIGNNKGGTNGWTGRHQIHGVLVK